MGVDPCETPEIIQVAEGFYVRQAIDNTAWIDIGGGAVVVDALEQPDLEGEVLGAIADTLGDTPVRHVLNTHTHYDHTALNPAFERRGATIVNARTTEIPPEGLWLEGPRRRVQMLPMPGCHTREDCVVWVPEDRALFAGDIFGWGLIPLMTQLDAETAQHLLDTYARLIAFDAATVIPGHGPLCTTVELRRWVTYFGWLRDQVSQAIAAGKDDSQIAAAIAPPEDMRGWWRFLQWKHEDSLTKMVTAVRRGDV